MVAGTVRIHNELVRTRPDLAAVLYEPYPYDFRGEQAEGSKPFYELPVCTERNGRLFVRCIPPYIWASQRHADAPRLSDLQREALQAVEQMAADPSGHVAMELRPGDIQLIDNYHVLHGRTAFEDDRDQGRVRHLKRLWLETDAFDSRPPWFANRSHWELKRSASRIRVGRGEPASREPGLPCQRGSAAPVAGDGPARARRPGGADAGRPMHRGGRPAVAGQRSIHPRGASPGAGRGAVGRAAGGRGREAVSRPAAGTCGGQGLRGPVPAAVSGHTSAPSGRT